jgi:hypothetical protein
MLLLLEKPTEHKRNEQKKKKIFSTFPWQFIFLPEKKKKIYWFIMRLWKCNTIDISPIISANGTHKHKLYLKVTMVYLSTFPLKYIYSYCCWTLKLNLKLNVLFFVGNECLCPLLMRTFSKHYANWTFFKL